MSEVFCQRFGIKFPTNISPAAKNPPWPRPCAPHLNSNSKSFLMSGVKDE
jgi:hypothetical protein